MNDSGRWFAIALIYVGFFALIASAVYITQSAIPLLALFLTPSFETSYDDDEKNEDGKKID